MMNETPSRASEPDRSARYPRYLSQTFERAYTLRYGENPHQTGAFYRARNAEAGSLARAESLGAGGKELSFNNFVDAQAARRGIVGEILARARPR